LQQRDNVPQTQQLFIKHPYDKNPMSTFSVFLPGYLQTRALWSKLTVVGKVTLLLFPSQLHQLDSGLRELPGKNLLIR
jgi:hypothetical protein